MRKDVRGRKEEGSKGRRNTRAMQFTSIPLIAMQRAGRYEKPKNNALATKISMHDIIDECYYIVHFYNAIFSTRRDICYFIHPSSGEKFILHFKHSSAIKYFT